MSFIVSKLFMFENIESLKCEFAIYNFNSVIFQKIKTLSCILNLLHYSILFLKISLKNDNRFYEIKFKVLYSIRKEIKKTGFSVNLILFYVNRSHVLSIVRAFLLAHCALTLRYLLVGCFGICNRIFCRYFSVFSAWRAS